MRSDDLPIICQKSGISLHSFAFACDFGFAQDADF
jgi:hypothetical protein